MYQVQIVGKPPKDLGSIPGGVNIFLSNLGKATTLSKGRNPELTAPRID